MAHDLVIAGGGLSGLLAAHSRLAAHGGERVLVVEAAARHGGDHTWSFHETDVAGSGGLEALPDGLVRTRWPGHTVSFPGRGRHAGFPYCSTHSDALRAALAPLVASGRLEVRTGAAVREARPDRLVLEGGEEVRGPVLDARGGPPGPAFVLGHQKFFGQRLRLDRPHGQELPCLMDATVPQEDGFRFVYTLPFTPDTVLVEDTYFSNADALDENVLRARVGAYVRGRGWDMDAASIKHEERGILPMTIACDLDAWLADGKRDAPRIGLRGGFFNGATGYSLPDAVRVANRIAALPALSPDALRKAVDAHKRDHWHRERFMRRLNRMMFEAGAPDVRYRVFKRFYGLGEGLIARFYAGELQPRDKLRLLAGRPPVPIGGAVAVLSERRYLQQSHRNRRDAAAR